MSILDNPLFNELFGKSVPKPEGYETVSAPRAEQGELEGYKASCPVEKNEIFLYRPEVLKRSLLDYLLQLEQAGASYTVISGYSLADVRVKIICKDLRLQEQLMNELHSNPRLEALLILKYAVKDVNLKDCIEECASIRWVAGYSDSLFLTVLCNITKVDEISSKESNPRTDGKKELEQLGIL